MTDTARGRDDWAAYWVARMDSHAFAAEDERALQAWCDLDPRNRGALLRAQALWVAGDRGAAEPDLAASGHREPQDRGWLRRPSASRRAAIGGAIAATAALAVGVRRWQAPAARFSTKVGQIRKIPLADGSVMTMNSGTEVKVVLAEHQRSVSIARGEAWFKVAKDAERPFVVASGKIKAQAVGTAFSVRVHESAVEVLVTEGTVETWSERDEDERVRLTAGQRAMMSEFMAVRYADAETSSVDRALAWRSGMVDLDGKTLTEAADEFNRYNKRQIIVDDAALGAEQFDGVFRANDPVGFANAVKNALGANVDLANPDLIRIRRDREAN